VVTRINEEIGAGATAHLGSAPALAMLAGRHDTRSLPLFQHGTLLVKFYAPRETDPQTPHTRDELYVVAQGSGIFFNGTTRKPFVQGDLIFVEAGTSHRFEDFTGDLGVWVVYYGPEGGESGNPESRR
jgi:mannose-6-phosphate isomerase-like protein (cupin superfamily)